MTNPTHPAAGADGAVLVPLADIAIEHVERLLDRAFGPGRRQRTSYAVRGAAQWLPALSFAALDGDALAGTIQCWPIGLTDAVGRDQPMIMIGPVAVLPEMQGRGFGKALMAATLATLDPRAPLPQVLIGDAGYYARFWDFSAAPTRGWTLPGPWDPDRLLVRCDHPGLLPRAGRLGPWRDRALLAGRDHAL